MKIFAKIQDQNVLQAAHFKAGSPLSETFRRNLSAEIYHKYSW